MNTAANAMRPDPHAGPSLAGITVLDLTRVVAGPYCTMMLADLGATVVKIEHPDDADYVRSFPPFADVAGESRSGFFAQYNRNKCGVTIDLKRDEGKRLFKEMIAKADVVVENFRPGTMKKLGLDYDTLRAINPALIYTAISGFGQSGPNSSRPAYDNSAQASGGLWSMNGMPDMPMRVGTIIGDLAGSFYATIGTLAALRAVATSGVGQMVDVSQQDSVLTLTENAVVNFTSNQTVAAPLGNDHPFVRPYGMYACRDGHVFFGAYTDKFWREACRAFGEPELAGDGEIDTMAKRFDATVYENRVRPVVERWCARYTKQELEALAGDRFPLSPIKNIGEVVNDPHVVSREMIVPVEFGGAKFEVFGSPIKMSGTTGTPLTAAPLLGQHNESIFLEWLGMPRDEYERLQKEGVI
ncbi:CaiB/BaiF CoA transferase family protein [Paraburkholderia sp. BCC1886]|uniref:CaiB/BaiF CoA transferase family protein n=1 Tax=Paraburkholderia sp. BCC1886 TaxID=2562670 RepID=UPI0011840AF1|nr:CoA transferase [Paraburkholderia sp. BCC1886]